MELTDIRTDARYLVSPQLTETDYPDEDLDRNANRWYRKLLSWIIPEQGDWEVEGDLIYRDFQAGVTDYEIPPNLIRLIKGEAMYETGGSFVPINFKSLQRRQDVAYGNETMVDDDASNPLGELIGNLIQVRPAPTETVVNGLKMWVQLDLVDLSTTNDVPNFVEPVQRVISVGAALDYAVAEEMEKKELSLKRKMFGDPRVKDDEGLKGDVKTLYANRSAARRDRLSAKKLSFN